MRLEVRRVEWPFASAFRIAQRARTEAQTIAVELHEGAFVGRGEALGVWYHGETMDSLVAQLRTIQNELAAGVSRDRLQTLLPPGGARNAIDCALWDLEAKRSGRRAWEIAGFDMVVPLTSAYTLSLDSPRAMSQAAARAERFSVLKLKLGGDSDVERVAAVRTARPSAEIIVDANQSWNERQLREFTPALAELGVKLIEQPLPAGRDEALADFAGEVALCADESCQTIESLPALVGKYTHINIKLDKTGGLTGALQLARAALAYNFQLMVGCMAGSSLSMAPAFIVGQLCSVVDLDGPLLSATDVPHGIRYEGSRMHPPETRLWG